MKDPRLLSNRKEIKRTWNNKEFSKHPGEEGV